VRKQDQKKGRISEEMSGLPKGKNLEAVSDIF